MRKSKFTEEQIIGITAGARRPERWWLELCRKHAISSPSLLQVEGEVRQRLEVSEARRLKVLEAENSSSLGGCWPRRCWTTRRWRGPAGKKVVTPRRSPRGLRGSLSAAGTWHERAAGDPGAGRGPRHDPIRLDQAGRWPAPGPAEELLPTSGGSSATAALHVLLRREGQAVNHKRVQRLYREEKLTVRRRGGRKRALGGRRPMETHRSPPTSAGTWTSSPTG